jgi:hypothetical protein
MLRGRARRPSIEQLNQLTCSAMRREAGKRRGRGAAGRLRRVPQKKKNLKLAGFRLHPKQIAALRREARRIADERDSQQPDASELVRKAVDEWLERHVPGYERPKS